MAYQMPNFGKLGQAVLLSARLGVTDVFKAPRNTAYDHPTAWTYLGRIAPGSYKNDFTRKFFDVVTGIPETTKESFVTEVEGKVEFDLIEPTTVGYLLASGNGTRIPAYGVSANVVNDKRNSVEDIYPDTTYGFAVEDEIEVNHTATRFYDGFDRDSSAFWESGGDVLGTWTHDVTNSRLTASAGSSYESLYLLKDASVADIDLEVSATQVHNGGLVWRYQDVNNYYCVQWLDDTAAGAGANITVWKRVASVFSQVGSGVNLTWTRGDSATLRVITEGSSIKVYQDGTEVLNVTDSAYTGAGRVGVRYNTSTAVGYYTSFSAKVPGNAAATDYTFITEVQGEANLVSHPENFEHAYWSKSEAAITSNAVISPSGRLDGDKLTESTATSAHRLYKDGTLVLGQPASVSFYCKAAERSWCNIGPALASESVYFDLATGTVGTAVGSGTTGTIESVGDGWYRCTWSTLSVITSSPSASLRVATGDTVGSYLGISGSGIYVWGAHVEQNENPVAYQTPAIRVFPRLTSNPEESSTIREIQVNSLAAGGSVVEKFALRAITTMTDGMQIVTWLPDCRVGSGIKEEYPDKGIVKLPISVDAFGVYDASQGQTLVGKKYLLTPDVIIDYAADVWSEEEDWLSGMFERTELGSVKPVVPTAGVFTRSTVAPARDFSGDVAIDTARYEDVLKAITVTHQKDWDHGATQSGVFSGPEGNITNTGHLDEFTEDTSWAYTSGGTVAGTWTWNTEAGRLEVVSAAASDYSTLIKNDFSAKNVCIEAGVSQAHYCSLVARYVDNSNYYMCNISDDSGVAPTANIRLWKRVAGAFTQIGSSVDLTFTRGTTYKVRFEILDSQLSVYVDDVLAITANDTALTAAGKVGMLNSATTASYFTHFHIKRLATLFARNSVANNPQTGASVAAGIPRYVRGKNLLTAALSNVSSGWTTQTNVGRIVWAYVGNSIVGTVNTELTGEVYAEIQYNGVILPVADHTFSAHVEITGHTTGMADIAIYDTVSGAAVPTLLNISAGNVNAKYSVTRTMRDNIDNNALSVRLRVRLPAGTNAGTVITITEAQLEKGSTSTTWVEGGDNAMLVEEATTNIGPASSNNFTTGWSAFSGAVPVITPTQADPYGGTNAYRVQTSGGAATTKYQCPIVAPSVNLQKYSTSIWIKNNSATDVSISNQLGAAVVVTQAEGWKLVKLEDRTGNGATNLTLVFSAPTAGDNLDFYAMWPQSEAKAYCTSYIAPGTTRAAEFLSLPAINSPADFAAIYQIYFDGDVGASPPLANHYFHDQHEAVNTNRLYFYRATTGGIAAGYRNAATQEDWVTYDPGAVTGWHTVGMVLAAGRLEMYFDGVQVASDTPAYDLPSAAGIDLYVGTNLGSTYHLNSSIGEVAILSPAPTAAEMLTLTA